jgi:hypothetical protein
MRIHTSDDFSIVKTLDKSYGRSLETEDHLRRALKLFFMHPKDELRKSDPILNIEAIHATLTQLQQLQRCFERNKCFAFYASSILIAYDAYSNEKGRYWGVKVANKPMATVKMIDFGRVQKMDGGDHGYLHGIKMLVSILKRLTEDSKTD